MVVTLYVSKNKKKVNINETQHKLSRPFPSSKEFHFQNEAKCETFVVEMSFNYDANKTHFHNKGFALSLVLKVKLFGTRKWPNRTGAKLKSNLVTDFDGTNG